MITSLETSQQNIYLCFLKNESTTDEAEASTMILLQSFFKLNLQACEDPHQ